MLPRPNAVSDSGSRTACGAKSGTSLSTSSSFVMPKEAAVLFALSLTAYAVYKHWATYPDLIPKQRGLRRISSIARRQGISREAAYVQWANQRLSWTRYRHLALKA